MQYRIRCPIVLNLFVCQMLKTIALVIILVTCSPAQTKQRVARQRPPDPVIVQTRSYSRHVKRVPDDPDEKGVCIRDVVTGEASFPHIRFHSKRLTWRINKLIETRAKEEIHGMISDYEEESKTPRRLWPRCRTIIEEESANFVNAGCEAGIVSSRLVSLHCDGSENVGASAGPWGWDLNLKIWGEHFREMKLRDLFKPGSNWEEAMARVIRKTVADEYILSSTVNPDDTGFSLAPGVIRMPSSNSRFYQDIDVPCQELRPFMREEILRILDDAEKKAQGRRKKTK